MSHLSSRGGNLLWEKSTEEERINGFQTHSVNDLCESTFDVFADQITTYNQIFLTNSGGMAVIKNNGDFNTGHKRLGKIVSLFILHFLLHLTFDTEFQEAGFVNQLYQGMQ